MNLLRSRFEGIMQKSEYCQRLRQIMYTCAVNQRYHHILEWRWGAGDKAIRIIVGIFAILGAVLAVPKLDAPCWGFIVALLSVVAAAVLNIVPVGDREKFHGEMFRLWGDLRRNALADELKTCDSEDDPPPYLVDHLREMLDKMESFNLEEPAPWMGLLNRCQEDENESEWGPGIRTVKQIEEERRLRLSEYTVTSAVSGEEAEAVSEADRE
jgi:hypothetical protein